MTSKTVKRRRGSIIAVRGAKGVSFKLKFDAPSTDGSRNTQYKSLKGTRKEAEAELARLLGEVRRGVDLDSGKQTLAHWTARWLEDVKPNLAIRSFERYSELLRLNILPKLGKRPLVMLTTMMIEPVYRELYERQLSDRTVRATHRVLNQCLGDAVRLRLLPENPCSHVKLRRRKSVGKSCRSRPDRRSTLH